MADAQGKLTEEEKRKIIAWLEGHEKSEACPVCATTKWVVGDHLLSGRTFTQGNLLIGGPSYPQFIVYCANCFYTRHFMAVPVLGPLVDVKPKEEKSAAPAEIKAPSASG